MSAIPNPVDGAFVLDDGKLLPMQGTDASAAQTEPDADMPSAAVPVAMTGGKQLTAARAV